MLRLLHCADAHLDTPFTLADMENADVRRAEMRAAFSSMMTYIRQSNVKLLLIAGDLFDHAFLTRETTALLRREFSSVPDCHIVIAPGRRDFYTEDSVYAEADFPQNVHIFCRETPACAAFTVGDDENRPIPVEVWGFACTSPAMGGYEPLAACRIPEKPAGTHRIFLGHAALKNDSPADADAAYVTKEQLARAQFDYCALGSLHNSDGIRRVGATDAQGRTGTTYFGYAGSLVGHGFDEPGLKGAVCGTLGFDAAGNTVFSVRRLRIARRRYECLDADVSALPTEQKTEAGVLRFLAKTLSDAVAAGQMTAPDRDTALRLTVSGTLGADVLLTEEAVLRALAPLGELVLCDRTVPGDTAYLAADPTLRGAYYSALSEALAAGDPALSETAVLALRLGLKEIKR